MKIIKADYKIVDWLDGEAILQKIEYCGRTCYKSEEKTTADSARDFVHSIIKRGHESVLEHVSFTVKFIVDRGVSHELVRHRIASFSQEGYMKRAEILEAARVCVCGEREQDYGTPEDSFMLIAKLWSVYTSYPITAKDVAIMMALLKVARIKNSDKADSYIDLAGYAACAGEITKAE